jgi:hypothetical protein
MERGEKLSRLSLGERTKKMIQRAKEKEKEAKEKAKNELFHSYKQFI